MIRQLITSLGTCLQFWPKWRMIAPFTSSRYVLSNDWGAIGGDIRRAMDSFEAKRQEPQEEE